MPYQPQAHEVVQHPGRANINSGRTPASRALLRQHLGDPDARRALDQRCQGPASLPKDSVLRKRIVTKDVGLTRRVTGLDVAVESLKDVIAEVEAKYPGLPSLLESRGMFCARLTRGTSASPSVHSWGIAIDFAVIDPETGLAHLHPFGAYGVQPALLMVYSTFRRHGWYWGAGFTRNDQMHFEVANETLRAWAQEGRL